MIEQTHELECDVLVAGGGPAGVPCAVAAARAGAKVILCQDRSVLGGNCSSEVRMHIVGADMSKRPGREFKVEAREGGIIEEVRLDTCVKNPQRSASMLDLVLYELCVAEPNLTLMLNTAVIGVESEPARPEPAYLDGEPARPEPGSSREAEEPGPRRPGSLSGSLPRITHAIAQRVSTEDRFRIAANVFIDCTGDGRLGAEAGAAYREGRESKEQFGEPLAQDTADNLRLGSTLLFQARKHDRPMPFVAPPWIRSFTEDDLKLRPHAVAGIDNGPEYGYWWVEWGGTLDTIKDNEHIRHELLRIMLGVWDHIKNGPPAPAPAPGSQNTPPDADPHGMSHWALDWFGFLPGKRESRRFIGQHTLTQSDVIDAPPQHDAIAYGGWPIDTHPPEGVDAIDQKPCTQTAVPFLYDIPLRCCVARDIPNLMFAGRNLSATHIAFASTRVMATCAAVGQGVGVAAAFAVEHERDPAGLANDDQAMDEIQQRLLREDAYLVGHANDDPHDLARRATVTASSHAPDSPTENIIDGHTRSTHGDKGAPPDRAAPGTHRWRSDPEQPLPAWLELRWDQAVTIREVQLTFDTGMHRKLTLTHSDDLMKQMQWGRPQAETVREYRLLGEVDGAWVELAVATGNHQRRRVHRLDEPVTIEALRLEVTATNGVPDARVFEVRVYG